LGVSVLVLVDVWWVQNLGLLSYKQRLGVSVLVLVDVWWVQCYGPVFSTGIQVSVLVLVDVWWVPFTPSQRSGAKNLGLGPCFSGCLVGTLCATR